MSIPGVEELLPVAEALGRWQYDGAPLQLHPGDLGWYSLNGVEDTAAAVRCWSSAGEVVAIGLLDGPDLLRLAIDPGRVEDEELAAQLAADVDSPSGGVLPAGGATVEARGADRLAALLLGRGWGPDEPWTPLRRDLAGAVEDCGLRVETIGARGAEMWMAVHWSAFRGSPCRDEDRARIAGYWLAMVNGPLYGNARSLAAFDEQGEAVAVAGVWSAGPGRPGLIEPMGVHRNHVGRGYGTAITRAAAAALREMGSSSAVVCAESSNTGALATYTAAGFMPSPEVADLRRDPA